MEGDHGHIEGGQKQGAQHAQVAQQGEGGGQQPALALVLGRLEEIPQHAGGQVAQRQAVDEDAHPPLGQPGAEAVGPLGILHQREGGAGGGDDILLNIARGQHRVDVNVRQLGGHLLHQVGIGEPLYIEDVHRRDRLAAHHLLTDAQLRGLQVAADDAGIGAQALHKGVPGALEHRLVAGRADGALFLGAHVEGEHRGFPRKEEQTAAVHQIKHRRVQPGTLLRAQVVEGPVLHAVHGLPGSPAAGQRLVLGQRPEHVVADPLHLHHAAEVA